MEKAALEEKQPKEVVVEEDMIEPAEERKKKARKGAYGWLRERKVRELVQRKRWLVEVPYTATLLHTLNALVANRVAAVPVAAPPGHWIGAGGSMILESDKATGAVRKHYIGMVTMPDILAHIAEECHAAHDVAAAPDLDVRMAVPVSSVIGHSLEGLSLWTLNPNTSILDCMESFSKGVHRALVPLESHADHVIAVELVEASPGYRMLTQMDLLSFLKENCHELKDILSCSVQGLGAINENVFAVTECTTVIEAIRSMRTASLNSVPVVESPGDGQPLQDGSGKRLADTFSATDLGGCPVGLLQSWLSMSIMEFKERVLMREGAPPHPHHGTKPAPRKLITCDPGTSLAHVMEDANVHGVWVVDRDGLLMGLVSLTDVLRVIRESVLLDDREASEVIPDVPA